MKAGRRATVRVEVKPELLVWARERAGAAAVDLGRRFPRLADWESGKEKPTLRQLERFAQATHVPLPYLLLDRPPEENLPIPDLRTPANRLLKRPSADLFDTLYLCRLRQDWYREYGLKQGFPRLPFVGSVQVGDDVVRTAEAIRETLRLSVEERRRLRTWTDALRDMVGKAEEAGILVMSDSVVGNNNRRPLDIEEFRGFVLVDDVAPLVFLNAADSLSGRMFTLAHELAHLWAGQPGVVDAAIEDVPDRNDREAEAWCNRVAAELLVPLEVMRKEWIPDGDLREEVRRLAAVFKVSPLVIVRRLYEAGAMGKEAFLELYEALSQELKERRVGPKGGNFYLTLLGRTGRRFAAALVESALEGRTLLRDACRLLGVSKVETLYELAESMRRRP